MLRQLLPLKIWFAPDLFSSFSFLLPFSVLKSLYQELKFACSHFTEAPKSRCVTLLFLSAAQYWASANLSELERITSRLQHNFKCYGIGNDLDFRIVALGSGFSRLHVEETAKEMNAASSRLFIFDYDTTLTPYGTLPLGPSQQVLDALKSLAADPANLVQIISRRSKEVSRMSMLVTFFHKSPVLLSNPDGVVVVCVASCR